MRIGYDFIGLLHPAYPMAKVLQYLPDQVPIGFLDYSFSKDPANLITLLDSGKVTAGRLTLINSVCARNVNCCKPDWQGDKHQLDKAIRAGKFDARVRERTTLYSGIFASYNLKPSISPLLEHDQSEQAWKRLADIILEVVPEVQLVNCPMSGWNGSYRHSIRETHDASSDGRCSSLDGVKDGAGILGMSPSERSAWRNKTKNHRYVLSWCNPMSLRASGPRICPLKRKDNLSAVWKEIVQKTYN